MTETRYSEHMVELVRGYIISGKTSNGDIAQVIAAFFEMDVSEADVARWRRQHVRFNRVCALAIDEANMIIANIAFEMAEERDPAMVRYWLDRRHPDFTPRQKTEHGGRIETLNGLLHRRLTEADLFEDGTLFYDEPTPPKAIA